MSDRPLSENLGPICELTAFPRALCLCRDCKALKAQEQATATRPPEPQPLPKTRPQTLARTREALVAGSLDRYGRRADECAASIAAARKHEAAMRAALADCVSDEDSIPAIVLGRLGGSRLLNRLLESARVFASIAERDEEYLADLEKRGAR